MNNGFTTWWNNLTTHWQRILAVHIDFIQNNITYKTISNQRSSSCFKIHEKLIGKELSLDTLTAEKLDQLDFLWLAHVKTEITNLSPISALRGIKYLYIGPTSITDLTPLSNLSLLEELEMTYGKLSDLTPLKSLLGLKKLICTGHPTLTEVSALTNLSNLKELHLSRTSINDIAPLGNLSGLEKLILDQTMIKDIRDLSSLNNMKELDIMYTQVSEIRNLPQGLSNFRCGDRPSQLLISGEEMMAFVKSHPTCIVNNGETAEWWG